MEGEEQLSGTTGINGSIVANVFVPCAEQERDEESLLRERGGPSTVDQRGAKMGNTATSKKGDAAENGMMEREEGSGRRKS